MSFSFETQEYWQIQKEETKTAADAKADVKHK